MREDYHFFLWSLRRSPQIHCATCPVPTILEECSWALNQGLFWSFCLSKILLSSLCSILRWVELCSLLFLLQLFGLIPPPKKRERKRRRFFVCTSLTDFLLTSLVKRWYILLSICHYLSLASFQLFMRWKAISKWDILRYMNTSNELYDFSALKILILCCDILC